MNILLAVDGSPYTQKMLAYLTSHPEILGAAHSYSAITVQPQLPARARAALGKDVVDEYYAEESTKVLDPVCSYLAEHGVQATRLSKVGPVAGPPGHGLGQHPGAGRQPGAGAADPLIRCPVDMQRP
jgi:hypothetical protein